MYFQRPSHGNFTATNCSLALLIRYAYDLRPFEVSGGPDWLRSDRYDIAAKGDGDAGFLEIRAMLQQLFQDRFELKFHWETKQTAVYDLVVSKPGKLHESDPGDCPPLGSQDNNSPSCGGGLRNTPGDTQGRKLTADEIAGSLSFFVGRMVRNKTGLPGKYDVDLRWTPDSVRLESSNSSPTIDASAPSIYSALQEQLGLKLQSARGPVKFLVIDRAERPSEN